MSCSSCSGHASAPSTQEAEAGELRVQRRHKYVPWAWPRWRFDPGVGRFSGCLKEGLPSPCQLNLIQPLEQPWDPSLRGQVVLPSTNALLAVWPEV
jgi:hypothetical protein